MERTEKIPLIVIAGPTAVGKSEAAVELACRIGGEIISADSMQIYRGMDIGTAKIRPDQMRGIAHHLIDICDPDESFDVTRYQELAKNAVREIHARGHIPILAGGTGFYIQAVLYDIDFSESETASPIRDRLIQEEKEIGAQAMHMRLSAVDPVSARDIHPNNIRRVIRALEFYEQTGMRISDHNMAQRQKPPAYTSLYFVLSDARERLYERIDRRVDQMMQEGLVEEVETLRRKGYTADMQSMQGLGYKELLGMLDGLYPMEEAVRLIKQGSRHYAKRQLTWFRRERDCIWIDRGACPDTKDAVDIMINRMEQISI